MDQTALMSTIDKLLEQTKTGVMTTMDAEGLPRMRWMTPTIIRDRPFSLFCITTPESFKTLNIQNPSPVSWMVQNKNLTEVVNCQGSLYLANDPYIKSAVLEHVAKDLVVYWKAHPEETDFVVLETVFTSGSYFEPMTNKREFVTFESRA